MDMKAAQLDMRTAYFGGGTGALVSGSVWIMGGLVALYGTNRQAVIAFLVAGMFIFPASVLVDKLFGRSGKHHKDNPLGPLALESTVMMMLGILIALGTLTAGWQMFFPVMLLIIAGRYLVFATIYGMKLYWIFAAALAAAGVAVFRLELPFYSGGLIGGAIEIVFAGLLMAQSKKMDA